MIKCRYWLTGKQNVNPGAKQTPDENGVGLEKALDGYAKWTPLFVFGCKLLQILAMNCI